MPTPVAKSLWTTLRRALTRSAFDRLFLCLRLRHLGTVGLLSLGSLLRTIPHRSVIELRLYTVPRLPSSMA